jgi:uncharacterized protein YpmS
MRKPFQLKHGSKETAAWPNSRLWIISIIILFLTLLALLMISSSHQIDRKVQRISELNREKRQLRSEFVSTRSQLMKLKMESSISRRLAENGLFISQTPPRKIKVRIEN